MSDSNNFLRNYQINHFKADTSNLIHRSFYKRYCGYLAYSHSLKKHSNQGSCLILQEKLREYSSLIYDKNGVNNFASVTDSMLENVNNRSRFWKSGLSTLPPKNELLSPLVGVCQNQSDHGCTSAEPSPQDVSAFFGHLRNLREKKEKPKQPIVPSFGSSSRAQQIEKPSLFSSYNEDENETDLVSNKKKRYQFGSNKYEAKKKGWKLWSKIEEDDCSETYNKVRRNLYSRYSKFCKSEDDEDDDNENIKTVSRKKLYSRYRKFRKSGDDEDDIEDKDKVANEFATAGQTLVAQINEKKFGVKKTLGGKGKIVSNKFVPPIRTSQEDDPAMKITRAVTKNCGCTDVMNDEEDERLKNIDSRMIEMIRSEIMDSGSNITWDDIAGLDFAKHTIQEIIVWPMLRPDIFTGLRRPPKGILLFGPPGTGKTLIGKCIASQSKSTFFSISASSLTSKWIGDGEKMVRALFAVARVHQPAVIFIDEIDSLLSQRSDQEHESSRRIKTEFLVQLDGAATGDEDRLLIIGATNRPQELDEAARRRLVKRLYIPLPDFNARKQLVNNLMSKERNCLTDSELNEIAELTDGYSGADMKNLCQEACLGPIRSISLSQMAHISADEVRPVRMEDFKSALKRVRSSVSESDLNSYVNWDKQFGMSS